MVVAYDRDNIARDIDLEVLIRQTVLLAVVNQRELRAVLVPVECARKRSNPKSEDLDD